MNKNELRDELLAVLAANRELSGAHDEALVDSVLAKLEIEQEHRQPLLGWREIYEQLVPLKFSTVLAIAAAQGVTLFALAAYLLKGPLDFYLYSAGMVYAWVVYSVIWLAEVLVTLAVLSILLRPEKPVHGERPASGPVDL